MFQALSQALSLIGGHGWLELPTAYAEGLLKGIGHKYIKRVPTGKTSKTGKVRYRYFYHAAHGGGVDAHEHMVAGAKFQHDGGHWRITSANGNKLTIEHDETGESKKVTKAQLGAMLRERHGRDSSPRSGQRLSVQDIYAIPAMADRYRVKGLDLTDSRMEMMESGAKVADLRGAEVKAARELVGKIRSQKDAHPSERAFADALAAHVGTVPKAAKPKVASERVEARQERPAPKPKRDPASVGKGGRTVVFFADKGGTARDHAAQWKVVEADSVHASHVPGCGFRKNANYPEGIQERMYHTDKAEQAKVLGNADRFRPELVHNTNPDAVNGAPLVTEDGVVLGGNSRTMTMQHLYSSERGHKVKDHLLSEAHQFGINPADIEAMKQPILVRVMTGIRADGTSKDEMRMLVRQANESFTQGMDPKADQVARALKLSDSAISSLAGALGEDETVAEFLAKPSGASRAFVDKLRSSGAIDSRNESQYLRPNGTLNDDGRNYVTKLFVGKLVPDPQLLSDIPTSTATALAKAAPYILAAKASGHEHDVTGDLRSALHALVEMDIHGSTDLDSHLRQSTINIDGKSLIGELDVAKSPRARLLFDVLQKNKGPNQLSKVFGDFAHMARHFPEGQEDLFGTKSTALDVLKKAAEKSVRKGGPYIGPKGGKYADPGLTHTWEPDATGGEQANWVGEPSDAARKARNAKVAKAMAAWKDAAHAHAKNRGDQQAYQAHYQALHTLGKALGLGTSEEAVDGAKRWLRAKGYRPDLHRGRATKPAAQEAFSFA